MVDWADLWPARMEASRPRIGLGCIKMSQWLLVAEGLIQSWGHAAGFLARSDPVVGDAALPAKRFGFCLTNPGRSILSLCPVI